MPGTDPLSWAALLAHWTELAAAARAWPGQSQGAQWSASVPHLIRLQAIAMALGEIGLLPAAERPLARDLAAVGLSQAAAGLDGVWRGEPMPDSILEVLEDAWAALERSAFAGMRMAWWVGDGVLEMPDVALNPDALPDTVAVIAPGTPVMPGCPVAWWVGGADPAVPGCPAQDAREPLQVYRQLDAHGHAVEDLIAPLDALPPGMPLLVPLRERGEPLGSFLRPRAEWHAMQSAALGGRVIPLRWDPAWSSLDAPAPPGAHRGPAPPHLPGGSAARLG